MCVAGQVHIWYIGRLYHLCASLRNLTEIMSSQAATNVTATNRLAVMLAIRIATFDGREELQDATNGFETNKGSVNAAISKLESYIMADPSTNLYGATRLALRELSKEEAKQKADGAALIVVTDGNDEAGEVTEQQMTRDYASFHADANQNPFQNRFSYSIYTGSAEDWEEASTQSRMKAMGRSGARRLENANALPDQFVHLQRLVAARATNAYIFQYCSPRRNGQYTMKFELDLNSKSKARVPEHHKGTQA